MSAPAAAKPVEGSWSYLRGKLAWMARCWRPHLHLVWVLVLMTAISAGVTLAYPLVFGYVLEELRSLSAGDATPGRVGELVWILIAVGVARAVAALYPAFRAWVNVRIDVFTRRDYFHVVLGKGPAFFTRFRSGDLVTRLTDDITGYPKIGWFCCSGVFRALESGSRVACCLGVMLYLSPGLSAYALIPVPLMLACYLLLKKHLVRAVEEQREASSTTSDHLEAAFTGVTVVQAGCAEERLCEKLAEQLAEREGAEVRLAQLWVLFSIFFQGLNVVGQLLVVLVGGLWVMDGLLSLGDFFSFYLYLGLLLGPMMDLPNLFVTGRQAFVCMDRLEELERYDLRGAKGAFEGERPLERLEQLSVRGLRYAYGEQPVLAETTLELRRGEKLAVIGPIGAGKTTLVRLLAGQLLAEEGELAINGEPFAALDGVSVRERIGFVPQDPVLFATTVRENVTMGREEDPERVARALDLAGLTEEVARFPGGLDHRLGLRGRGVSGGQRQRLTIARALYGEPELLLLDDVTAALDAENEDHFWERVLSTWPEVTVLVVTHRAATATRMDRQLRLQPVGRGRA
ncbi:MAG: ABC transporter ATP-binding protein [Planctomycetes bacterium]|nr:ABC transporter ATP-binding protein [Planctomycetota bacterium]